MFRRSNHRLAAALAKEVREAHGTIRLLNRRLTHTREQHRQAEENARRLGAALAEIKAALGQVAVYEGLVEVSPTAMLVSELVRDHEELEARIDAVMSMIAALHDDVEQRSPAAAHTLDEIARLLRGGTRVPDTPEALG